MIYLLGSRRVADPGFLAFDFTWSRLPPTSALFDHLIAPLWKVFDEFTIVNIGRFSFWALFAAGIAMLARTARLPAWSAFTGFAIWVLWRQTLLTCGSPLEGFQVKAFSYPLMFFALHAAIRGRVAWAGACAGLGTAFHIVIGGWGLLGLLLSMLVNRKLFTLRQVVVFLLAATPFVAPMLVYVGLFHAGNVTPAERALMDQIYVRFAMPHCCDFSYFMYPMRWVRAGLVFAIAPLLLLTWGESRVGRILGVFVLALIAFFVAGVGAQALKLDALLKLYPTQLANSLPPLLLFLFAPAWLARRKPGRDLRTLLSAVVLAGTLWLVLNRDVPEILLRTPFRFAYQVTRPKMPVPLPNQPLYDWIKTHTPRDAVFITPLLTGFWTYAERAQVATMRHPPLDKRLIEWKERLEAINRFRPYREVADDIHLEQDISLRHITVEELIRIRERYGATHLMLLGERKDLAAWRLHSFNGYSVYELRGLKRAP
jgi:hypothetical protein